MNPHFKGILFACLISANAICFWNEVFAQTHSTKPDSTQASELFEKARIFRGEAQHDSADFYFEKAKGIYENIRDWENYVECCNRVADQMWQQHKNRQMIDYLESNVLQRFAEKNVEPDTELKISESLAYIAIAHALLQQYEQSLQFFQNSLSKKIKILGEETRSVAVINTNIGHVYRLKREFRKAAEFYNRSLEIRRQTDDKFSLGFAHIYAELRNLYREYGDYDKAMEYAHKALQIHLRRQFPQDSLGSRTVIPINLVNQL